MSQQSDKARASVTSLTPEPEFSKSGIPLHMMDPLQIEEEIPASDLPDKKVEEYDDFPQSLEEALLGE